MEIARRCKIESFTPRRLPFDLALKFKYNQDPHIEVSNTCFIETQTSIPVPRIRDVLSYKDSDNEDAGLIVMDWIEGQTLGEWIEEHTKYPPVHAECMDLLFNHDLSIAEVDVIQAELDSMELELDLSHGSMIIQDMRNALEELRSIPAPSSSICGLGGRPLLWLRNFGNREFLPPMSNIATFHEHLLRIAPLAHLPNRKPHIDLLTKPVFEKHYSTHFTHSDLHAGNILVRNGRLAAILDWECAGWYPEYWECTSIYFKVRLPYLKTHKRFWEAVGVFSDQYRQELAMEQALWPCTGDLACIHDS
ncbi:hypothetical protein NP233_g7417 [Leucocoprinus birnbaumii]|uniref:Aminoglycoside phosphotransferase domain-containing protein n=1 Tax=Leucocoprinus birnbaumii TaxID=56174 RepID=A0AAD5YQ02_9AGAR|nr:hypothetical protein NP233_g7417 [Leucocoprinus birnbaumii]